MTVQSQIHAGRESNPFFREQLRSLIAQSFDLAELRTLCFDLEVDFDELHGEGKSEKIRELIGYMERHYWLNDLLAALARTRPHISWPGFSQDRPQNPYQGLDAFQEGHAPFFFGREEFTQRLVTALRRQNLVAVIGSSGSGKSSVVFAGLVPRLRGEGKWLVARFRPGKRPYHALAAALIPLLEPGISETDLLAKTPALADILQAGNVTLEEVIGRILREQFASYRVLLIADQFEELYTLGTEPEIRQAFLGLLLQITNDMNQAAVSAPRSAAKVVLTLRADFLGQVLSNRSLADALQEGDVKLGPMSRQEMYETIQKPAEKLGVKFEVGLVDRILDDTSPTRGQPEPGNLALLEFALTLLWEWQTNNELTHVAYETIGQVKGALVRYAEEVYKGLPTAEQMQLPNLLVQLVQPGVGTEATRRLATRVELTDEQWWLAQRLAAVRLVVTNRDEADQETAEIVHEALIQQWQRLQEWMQEHRAFRTWQERLRAAMEQWVSSSRDEGALLRGSPLAEAEGWLAMRGSDLIQGERAFIETSIHLRLKETAEREARQQRELEQARALAAEQQRRADVERQRADEQTRSASQLRRRALYLGLALLAAIIASIGAWNALQNEADARQQAEERQEEAERQSNISLARQLVAQAQLAHGDKALLLALEASYIVDSKTEKPLVESEEVLRAILGQWSHWQGNLIGHTEHVRGVVFGSSDELVLSAAQDGRLLLWPWQEVDAEPQELMAQNQIVYSIAYDTVHERIAVGLENGQIQMFKLESLIPESEFRQAHSFSALALTFTQDGRRLVSGGGDGIVKIWRIDDSIVLDKSIQASSDWVRAVAISPDSRWLAAGGDDQEMRLWDLTSEDLMEPVLVELHLAGVRAVSISHDSRWLVSGSEDGSLHIFALDNLQSPVRILRAPQIASGIWSLAFAPRHNLLAIGTHDGVLASINLDNSMSAVQVLGHLDTPINTLAFSPSGTYLATGSDDNSVRLWSIEPSNSEPQQLQGHSERIRGLAFSPLWDVQTPETQIFVSAGEDETIRIWSLADRPVQLHNIFEPGNQILSIAISPDARWLASGGRDGIVRLYSLTDYTGEPISLQKHSDEIIQVAFSPDGQYLTSGSSDKRVFLWDVENLTHPPQELRGYTGGVLSLAFEQKGQFLAVGDQAGYVYLWDMQQPPEAPRSLYRHQDWVWSLAFSPDGRYLVSASADGTFLPYLLGDNIAGEPITAHNGRVRAVAFSPDGLILATAGDDSTIKLWDPNDLAQSPVVLRGHNATVRALAFSPDGTYLASGGDDHIIQIWTVSLSNLRTMGCTRIVRNLSVLEWEQYFGSEPYRATCPGLES